MSHVFSGKKVGDNYFLMPPVSWVTVSISNALTTIPINGPASIFRTCMRGWMNFIEVYNSI